MNYCLAPHALLKLLEQPCVYHVKHDELYEIDEDAFRYLCAASEPGGTVAPADKEFLSFCLEEGILLSSPVYNPRPVLIQSPIPSLRYLELQLTTRCNLRCRHCFVGDAPRIDLPLDLLRRLLDEFQIMQGLRLLISGGEPILHSHFMDFNEMLPDYAFRKVLFTNGQLLNNDLLARLHVDEIQISIDGMERGHDLLRGGGTFQKAIKTAERIRQAGLQLSIATMVHHENLDEFPHMQQLFESLGASDWTVDIPSASGFLCDHPELIVPPDIAGKYLSFGFGGGSHGGSDGYACGLHLASVLANGAVCKCAFYADTPVGSIQEGLAAAWARILPVPLSTLYCAEIGCSVIDECKGGCRYRAEQCADTVFEPRRDGLGADLYRCYAYGIMKPDAGYENRR